MNNFATHLVCPTVTVYYADGDNVITRPAGEDVGKFLLLMS